MTWKELGEEIAAMTPVEQGQPARFVEPYDKDRAGFELDLVRATEDIRIGEDRGDVVFVLAGEWMLR